MRDKDKVKRYLLEMRDSYRDMVKSYFRAKSYGSKLKSMDLDESQKEELDSLSTKISKFTHQK